MIPPKLIVQSVLLQHVSWKPYLGKPLFYGRGAASRYGASDNSYGVLYLAHDLSTALMESVFHKHQWHKVKRRTVSQVEVDQRLVRFVEVTADLRLADLTAPNVVASQFGMNLAQLTSRRYAALQAISKSIHGLSAASGQPSFDGINYPSRNNPSASCIALFDRASHKVSVALDADLTRHRDWPPFVSAFRIAVI